VKIAQAEFVCLLQAPFCEHTLDLQLADFIRDS
jgi:hypothetical protein